MTGSFPVEEQDLTLSPYVRTRVARVGENSVTLEMQAENGQTYEEAFGTVEVIVEGEEIRTRLTPKIGADFQFENRTGRIVASDGANFTVDFNSAVANQALVLDLEVLSRVPAGTYADRTIFWHEELATGLEAARQENKPAVLVLYADWCTWCERLLNESVEDPRVKGLTDRFVWMKINSDVEQQFKERFGQKSFPMVVYFAPDGAILYQAEGFKDGTTLHRELRNLSETLL
jgi:thiol-disulfide isomerase/thioredoxin